MEIFVYTRLLGHAALDVPRLVGALSADKVSAAAAGGGVPAGAA